MAVKPFSKDQLNFFKFSTLVLDEFPKVLRTIFITMWDSKVAIRPGSIVWDDSIRVRNMLLASEGGKTDIPTAKSIKEWDCTVLFKATIYAKTFGVPSSKGTTLNDLYLKKSKPASGSFHSSVQSLTGNQDETYALAIDQLRLLRNTLCHSPKPEIIRRDFDNYVQLVKNALTAVNVDTAFVDVIGQMNEDDFPTEKVQELHECRLKELQAITKFHETVEQKLSSLDEKIERMMRSLNLGENKNLPDSLPKSHIPSTVRFFIGREVEIENITNLITGQSTRLLNIWGTPGFGKTSTAIAVAHHLSSLGYSVYFFKLQLISKVDEFLSKILSIFKSNLEDLNLTPVDKLVSNFRDISCPIFLIFDNLDDLLSNETAGLLSLFEEFVDSNDYINILFTTRELLEIMRDQVQGFQDVRIRPLSLVSSFEYVHQLLDPLFSENVVAKVVEICSHVPLAMKVVASLIQNNSEEMANTMLEEIKLSENLLNEFDENMKRLFDAPFEQLTLTDKHALLSLTVFSSAIISKDAAINVVSGETGVTTKAVQSLKTLVNKSLIDCDPKGECYSIHPLIYSFVVDKAKHGEFDKALKTSAIQFCKYYFRLFEMLNDDFLAGKSVNHAQLQDTMMHLSTAMFQSITYGFKISQDLFLILAKSEIFLSFLTCILFNVSLDIHKLYDLAIHNCRSQSNDSTYLKLYISQYFQGIFFSPFVSLTHSDIPEDIRKYVMLLSDGSAEKLGCYEGMLLITKGNIKSGIQLIEKHFEGLQRYPDQQIVKCLCLQLVALFYTHLKEESKASNFSRMAIEVCKEVGNYNLFLIRRYDQTELSVMLTGDKGEPSILFVYFLCWLSEEFLNGEAKRVFLSVVYELQQQKEKEAFGSKYLNNILSYSDYVLAVIGGSSGQGLLNEKIGFLEDSFHKSLEHKDCMSRNTENVAYLSERLLHCYFMKIDMRDRTNNQDLQSVETCRNALELSLQQCGKQHGHTVGCYLRLGSAENDAENYISALDAFSQALEIMEAIHDESNSNNDIVANLYISKGKTYTYMNKLKSAIECYDEALKLKRRLVDEDTEEIANILYLRGVSQYRFEDFQSAYATGKQALHTWITIYTKKRSLYLNVVNTYILVAMVNWKLENLSESSECLKSALELSTDCEKDRLYAQGLICEMSVNLNLQVNENIELIDHSLPVIKEHYEFLLPRIYLTVGLKQLESGKYKAGVAFLHKALHIELDVTLRASADTRVGTVSSYIAMVKRLLDIGSSKLARKTLDKAFKITESLPVGKQHPWMFRCCYWKGRIDNKEQEYVSAIASLEHALQLPCVTYDHFDRKEEFQCHEQIAIAHFFQGTYKHALTSLYQSLSIIKNIFPDGSKDEADVYNFVAGIAQKMKNRSLVVSNLHLAYKMYSKVLGEYHAKTVEFYVAYARELIKSSP